MVLAPLSLMAVIVTVPGAMAVTLPFWSTLAMVSSLDIHDTPLMDALLGLYDTVREIAPPTLRSAVRLFIDIEDTGLVSALTVMVVEAVTFPVLSVTVILAVPARTPVITPFVTVATAVFDELHLRDALSPLNGVI